MSLETVAPAAEPAAPITPVVEAPVAEPTTPTEADAITEKQTLETFAEKHPRRHRARSQQASPDDVPRIRELTAKLREAEEKLARATPAAAPVTEEPKPAATPRAVAPAVVPPRVITADKDPEPTEQRDPSTGKPYEDFGKFTRDSARWAAREEMREARTAFEKEQATETAAQEETRLATAWSSNVEAAKAAYKDFEQVAYGPSEIPQNSLIDRWIREHPAGPLVLYSLKKNPTELRAMLALPLFEQTEALSLLSQRVRPRPGSVAAVVTGAAPVIDPKPVPRPPTPVRTGPMRTEPAVPDTEDLSLDDFAEATGAVKKRRA